MKRRSRVGGVRANSQRAKAAKAKRRNAPKAVSHPDFPQIAEQIDTARRERDEGLEQLSAASEILKVINSSPEWPAHANRRD